jgi:hypothetical protein
MIEQGRGRVSFCSAGRTRSPGEDHCFTLSAQDHSSFSHSVLFLFDHSFQLPSFHILSFNISTVSPGTMRADSAHSSSARGTVRWVKVAVGGLASLLQWIGKGASRQRLHIISGRHKLRAFRSWAAGIPWARQAWQPAAGVVVDTVWMVEPAARVVLYGGQELATSTIPPGGYGPRRALDHLWVSLTGSVIDAVRLEGAGLRWAGSAWHRHRMSSAPGVLGSILDGTYIVAKNGLPRRPWSGSSWSGTFRRLGREFVAGSSDGAAGDGWGGQWQTTVAVNQQAVEPQAGLSWSQEWAVGFYRVNRPSTMLSFVGLQLDTVSGLVVPSGSRSTLRRVDLEGDASEAHNLWPGAGSHAAVPRSLVAGSTGNTFSYGPGQANVWRAAASWLRADARAYGVQSRVREPQTHTQPSTRGVPRRVTLPLVRTVQGARSLRSSRQRQGAEQMEDGGSVFTERWHYMVPPFVRGPVFALERDSYSGETRVSEVGVSQWEFSTAPGEYRLRMGWWWLTPGQRVFGLVMGRHPRYEDQTLYHVPPSRYTLATVDWFQGPDRGDRDRFFTWLVELDGIEVDIRGGRFGCTRRDWHVFSEEVAPYVSDGQAADVVMAFHPDSPVWGEDMEALLGPADPVDAGWQRAPIELRLAHHAGGRGASRARSAVAWRQDTSAEAQATSGAAEAASRSQAPGDAGATEAQD